MDSQTVSQILSNYLATPAGRAKLAASMTAPLRMKNRVFPPISLFPGSLMDFKDQLGTYFPPFQIPKWSRSLDPRFQNVVDVTINGLISSVVLKDNSITISDLTGLRLLANKCK